MTVDGVTKNIKDVTFKGQIVLSVEKVGLFYQPLKCITTKSTKNIKKMIQRVKAV